MPLTGRTVPVATGVELQVQLLTARTPVQVSAQFLGAAFAYGVQSACVPTCMRYVIEMFHSQVQDIRHFIFGPHYLAYRVSRGLNLTELPESATCRYMMVVSIWAWPNSSFKHMMFIPSSSKWVA